MQKILIVGGTGFLGFHLAKKCLSKGWKVHSVSTKKPKKLRYLKKVKYIHFNIVNKNTKLVHFSHVRSQPWKNVNHELTEFWAIWLKEAIKSKAVSRITVFLEIIKGNVDRYFLRYLF